MSLLTFSLHSNSKKQETATTPSFTSTPSNFPNLIQNQKPPSTQDQDLSSQQMGGSRKWMRALVGFRKSDETKHEKVGEKGKKWKLWRSSSTRRSASEASDASSVSNSDALSAAIATLVRIPPKEFRMVRQEWAVIRIQTAFRGFLARRALRALKAVVRLQAIVRGRRVRKQAAVTLRCMEMLVRVQAHIRGAHRVPDVSQSKSENSKETEEGWCDSQGTLEEVRAKLQIRKEGAIKRERAIAYSLSKQRSTSTSSLSLLGTPKTEFSENHKFYPSPELCSVNVRKNNVSTRISARPHFIGTPIHRRINSVSSFSSEIRCGECCASLPSSINAPTQIWGTTYVGCDRNGNRCQPSYMKLTESIKAKRRSTNSRPSREFFHKNYCEGNSNSPSYSDPSLASVNSKMEKDSYKYDTKLTT